MSSDEQQPSMEPTVEEVQDESETKANSSGNRQPHSWTEVCSQHESVLSAHLQMLKLVKNHVSSDGDSLQILASMVDKTEELMGQFKVIKKQIMHSTTRNTEFKFISREPPELPKSQNYNNENSTSSTSRTRETKSTSAPLPSQLKGGKKRSRAERDSLPQEQETTNAGLAVLSQKRKRTHFEIPGFNEEVKDATPMSTETEDISAEVQRRLEIKEEQRRKRYNAKPEKRKRDSLASNASISSPGEAARPKRKKFKTEKTEKDFGDFRQATRIATQSL